MGILLEARVQEPVQQQHSAAVVPIQEEQISKMINNVSPQPCNILAHFIARHTSKEMHYATRLYMYRMLSMYVRAYAPLASVPVE